MTNKRIVLEFLEFLYTHKGNIVFDGWTIDYKELHDAIIDVISQAMIDGYKARDTQEYFDVSVSSIQKDW